MKKKRTVKLGIVVAILMLMVGFAAVSTTLFINGQAVVGSNQADFEKNVVFANDSGNEPKIEAQLDTPCDEAVDGQCGMVGIQPYDPEGTGNGIDDTEIYFLTPVMKHIGDKVTVSYKVKNNSRNYDARMGALTCSVVQETEAETDEKVNWEDYITVKPQNLKSGALVQAEGIYDTYDTIEIEMIKSYVGEKELSFAISCTIDAAAEVISK